MGYAKPPPRRYSSQMGTSRCNAGPDIRRINQARMHGYLLHDDYLMDYLMDLIASGI